MLTFIGHEQWSESIKINIINNLCVFMEITKKYIYIDIKYNNKTKRWLLNIEMEIPFFCKPKSVNHLTVFSIETKLCKLHYNNEFNNNIPGSKLSSTMKDDDLLRNEQRVSTYTLISNFNLTFLIFFNWHYFLCLLFFILWHYWLTFWNLNIFQVILKNTYLTIVWDKKHYCGYGINYPP